MKKFEYYSFWGNHGDGTDQMLDELGKQGWEAFAVVPHEDKIVVYLKGRNDNEHSSLQRH